MRTTIDLDDDTSAAIEQLRHDERIGLSAAVNKLIRRGLAISPPPIPFRQPTRELGLRIDVSNVAEALDLLESDDAR